MIPAQRLMAAAALVFVLCASTSCDPKPARKIGWRPSVRVANLINEAVTALQEDRNADALAAYQKALTFIPKNHEPMGWANIATEAARVHMLLSGWKEAEILLTEVVRLREQPSSPEAADSLGELAMVLTKMDRLAEAEPLLRRALAIDQTSFGKDSFQVGLRLHDITRLLQAANRLAEAEPLIRRMLAIDETSIGKDSIDVAFDLGDLVRLLKETNRPSEAEPLQSRYFEIMIPHVLAMDDPDAELDDMISEFRALRMKMGDTEAEAQEKLDKLMEPVGKK